MIHLKLGEAYEALGEISLSVENYEQAEILFPMAKWKAEARAGVERAKRKLKEREATGLTPVPRQETRTMRPGPQDFLIIFRGLETLLSRIETKAVPREDLSAKINRLEREGQIPVEIKNHMHYLRTQRNVFVHPGGKDQKNAFVGPAARAILETWSALKEWAKQRNVRTDDLP